MKNTTHTHTPGPWKLNFPLITAQDNMALTVAVVLSREDSNARKDSAAKTNAEAMANARLIAAAPELLAALQLVYANAGESPEWIRARIDSVISKAGGNV